MKVYRLVIFILFVMFLVACSSKNVEPDYNTTELEEALNSGEDTIGKVVEVEIKHIEPASAFGHNLQAGEHLNFVSSKNPGHDVGDVFLAKIEEVDVVLGSFIIRYK